MIRARLASLNRMTCTLVLVLSMLFAQFVGQLHRIEHTQWATDAGEHSLAQWQNDDPGQFKNHSCILFDQDTLALAMGIAFVIALATAGRYLLTPWVERDSWLAPVIHLFLSRAPPSVR